MTMEGNRIGRRLGILVAAMLVAGPLAVLGYKLTHYGLDFPYWDEMLIAPLIAHAKTGQLRFIELWSQHNEHRPLFPRLIMLALALPSDWNVAWVLSANLVCGVGIFLSYAWLVLRKTAEPMQDAPDPFWVLPVFAFFVFSWGQMENWVWGLELTVLLCSLAVVAGMAMLGDARCGWWGFAGAAMMGVVASYSFANGVLYWFAAIPALLAMRGLSREQKTLRVLLWCVIAFLTLESYFFAYHKPGVSPPLTAVLQHPLSYIGYLLLYLGSPVVSICSTPPWHGGPPHPYGPYHFIPGAAGVLLFAWVLLTLWRSRRIAYAATASWLSIAAFAVLSALATGIGRVGLGAEAGLYSRYMTTNAMFWCALFALIAVGVQHGIFLGAMRTRRWTFAIGAVVLVLANVLVVHQQQPWEENATWKNMGWQAILAGDEAPLYLKDLSWDPKVLQTEYLPILKEFRLAGFGKPLPPKETLAQAYLAEAKTFAARKMWLPALTYIGTALRFDPTLTAAIELRNTIPAEIQKRFLDFQGETIPGNSP